MCYTESELNPNSLMNRVRILWGQAFRSREGEECIGICQGEVCNDRSDDMCRKGSENTRSLKSRKKPEDLKGY